MYSIATQAGTAPAASLEQRARDGQHRAARALAVVREHALEQAHRPGLRQQLDEGRQRAHGLTSGAHTS